MITLPQSKRWTGDGFGNTYARILTQVKRTDEVALYERTVESSKRIEGFEVFLVKIRHKGDALPGGAVEAEDREVYPGSSAFGRIAWHVTDKAAAEKLFDKLVNGEPVEDVPVEAVTDETPETPSQPKTPTVILLPVGEFSVKDLAESNKVEYPIAYLFVKDQLEKKLIQVLREERRSVKGKPTKIYGKTNQ